MAETPAETMRSEHAVILRVVDYLPALSQQVREGQPLPELQIPRFVEFFRNYADRFHHAKEEELLFPFMEAHDVPHQGCPISALLHEHASSRNCVAKLENFTEIGEPLTPEQTDEFVHLLDQMHKLYHDHIWKEDEMVFPMLDRIAHRPELQSLAEEFGRVGRRPEFARIGELVRFADNLG